MPQGGERAVSNNSGLDTRRRIIVSKSVAGHVVHTVGKESSLRNRNAAKMKTHL